MAELDQLKAMRDAAQKRLESSPDYRLNVSLSKLIDELEALFAKLAAASAPTGAATGLAPQPTASTAITGPAAETRPTARAAAPVGEVVPNAAPHAGQTTTPAATTPPSVTAVASGAGTQRVAAPAQAGMDTLPVLQVVAAPATATPTPAAAAPAAGPAATVAAEAATPVAEPADAGAERVALPKVKVVLAKLNPTPGSGPDSQSVA